MLTRVSGAARKTAPAPDTREARALANTLDAVSVAVLFACNLGPVPDQEAGVAGEFVLRLRDDLHDEFLGDNFPARADRIVKSVGFIQFSDNAAGIRSVGGLQRLQGISCDSLTSDRTSS